MKEIRTIECMKVREMCIKDDWYTCGTNENYNNLLFNLCNKEEVTLKDIEEIAADILVHSVWEKKAEAFSFNYDELLMMVMENLINECCYSTVVADNK